MKIFIYYDKNENNEEADVAAVQAKTLNEAIKALKQYYVNVTKDNVVELTFKDNSVMIISDY